MVLERYSSELAAVAAVPEIGVRVKILTANYPLAEQHPLKPVKSCSLPSACPFPNLSRVAACPLPVLVLYYEEIAYFLVSLFCCILLIHNQCPKVLKLNAVIRFNAFDFSSGGHRRIRIRRLAFHSALAVSDIDTQFIGSKLLIQVKLVLTRKGLVCAL